MNRKKSQRPRILVVTPEITYLPQGMGHMALNMNAKAGGLADVSAALVSTLFDLGADVHVALPHYRRMFHMDVGRLISNELRLFMSSLPDSRIHLAEDRAFYYREQVYSDYNEENPRLALIFQREVINHIIPTVNPDLIHCNDWMTGLIPAFSRRLGIPCLFTLHNIHTHRITLERIEDTGIDAAGFWRYLYYDRIPACYEETRATNPVDTLVSGVFASHFINTVSPTFLREVVEGRHDFIPDPFRAELAQKYAAGCATGILNAPDSSFNPRTDPALAVNYSEEDHTEAKRRNKIEFQRRTGLAASAEAPLLFWPSRLDPVQKGPQLLSDILYRIVSEYWNENLQIAVVANGAFQQHFHDIVRFHDFHERVAVCDFDENLSRLGYAAADYMLMPSRFEPCGLPQMIACLYGTLPIVHDTGGLRDTIELLDPDRDKGNGFVFTVHDANGLHWAIREAMRFHHAGEAWRKRQIARVMRQSRERFNHKVCAEAYIDIYERMTERPLVKNY